MNRVAWCLLALILLMLSPSLRAQSIVPADSLHAVSRADSSAGARSNPSQRYPTQPPDTTRNTLRPRKSATKAMLFSAILPGAGQAYNQSYWKVPIVLGLGIYFAYEWLDNNRRYRDYRDQYSASLITSPPSGDSRLLSVREFYKDQRDSFAWYFTILYAINILDAYVDASLYDFNVSGDLSIKLLPPLLPGPGMQLSMKMKF